MVNMRNKRLLPAKKQGGRIKKDANKSKNDGAESPKPGTAGSKQAFSNKRVFVERQKKMQTMFETFMEQGVVDTNGMVDESIVLFKTEMAQMLGLSKAEIPEDPAEFCKEFTIEVVDLGLKPRRRSPK